MEVISFPPYVPSVYESRFQEGKAISFPPYVPSAYESRLQERETDPFPLFVPSVYENRLQEWEAVSVPPLVASVYENRFQERETVSLPPPVPSVYESGLTELENVSLSPLVPSIYEGRLMQPQISPTNGMISEWLQEPAINVPAMEHQTQLTQVQKQQIIEGSTAKPNQSAKPTIPETQPKPQTQQQRAQNTPSLWERKLLVDSIRDALIAQLSAGVSRPTNRIF